jgi:hypothetical protein
MLTVMCIASSRALSRQIDASQAYARRRAGPASHDMRASLGARRSRRRAGAQVETSKEAVSGHPAPSALAGTASRKAAAARRLLKPLLSPLDEREQLVLRAVDDRVAMGEQETVEVEVEQAPVGVAQAGLRPLRPLALATASL